jgi:hypothetical protein
MAVILHGKGEKRIKNREMRAENREQKKDEVSSHYSLLTTLFSQYSLFAIFLSPSYNFLIFPSYTKVEVTK